MSVERQEAAVPPQRAGEMTTNDRTGRRIAVFDTTLRDGEQAPGNGMGPDAKLELGLARGKQLHDRRRDIADRDARRDVARELADAQRGR